MRTHVLTATMAMLVWAATSTGADAQSVPAAPTRELPVMGSVYPARYPPQSIAAKEEGLVKLRAVIDNAGWTTQVRVIESSGHPRLDESAVQAARHWRYRPGTIDGVPTAMPVNIPVRFVLPGGTAQAVQTGASR